MLSKDALNEFLAGLKEHSSIYVAYSGGLDSHVLMHLLSKSSNVAGHALHSIHVNHKFAASSDEWAKHCELTAEKLGYEHRSITIDEKAPAGDSLEAWARERRYKLMAESVPDTGVLLTAHHRDDQAETLLLQLLRGSGVSGLAAMPTFNTQFGVLHGRPLLNFSRKEIAEYAHEQQLEWIDDESNLDPAFDRNYLRHNVFPVLRKRWPALDKTMGRAASQQADALQIIEEVAANDLVLVSRPVPGSINIKSLKSMSLAHQANVLRYWIKTLGLPLPTSSHVEKILMQVVDARHDGVPLVNWPGCEIRRHDGQLFAMAPLAEYDKELSIDWSLQERCSVAGGQLCAKKVRGLGIRAAAVENERLRVQFRQGGEKIHLPGKQHSQELKKLFQEFRIPSWLRDRVPLLYKDKQLVAVADFWTDSQYLGSEGEQSWQISWQPDPSYMNILSYYRES